MKNVDWNDLRLALALGREPTLTSAAKALGTSQPTASRRLAALERALGAKLFLRGARGYVPTEAGKRLLGALSRIAGDLESLDTIAADDHVAEGRVRVAITDVSALHLLEKALPRLAREHPKIVVELLVSMRTADLARREADLAVRLIRPEGADLVARSLGAMRYGFFATKGYLDEHGKLDPSAPEGHAFIEPIAEIAESPEGRFLRETIFPRGGRASLRASGMLVMAHAAGAGLGIAVLPEPIAAGVPSLRRLAPVREIHARSVYLVAHQGARKIARVRVVMDAIDADLRARIA
jgi:DNA-binding transcriptional LysR family regulator